MTNAELESAYNTLAARVKQIERQLLNVATVPQLNAVVTLLEGRVKALETSVETLQNRVTVIEGRIDDLV
jgi:chaperonin cofactor prefoldin